MPKLDDTVKDFEYLHRTFENCNFKYLFSKEYLRVVYTNNKLSSFLGVSENTKTNIYTILKRIKLYIKKNNLCINGVILPDDNLSSILTANHKYCRITYNTLVKYISP